jgi:hypothetical protein
MPKFTRYIGVPTASLNGLRIFVAQGEPPAEVLPPPSPRKYWTGRGIAERLVELGALPPGHRNCPLCFPCASQSRFLGSYSGAYLC